MCLNWLTKVVSQIWDTSTAWLTSYLFFPPASSAREFLDPINIENFQRINNDDCVMYISPDVSPTEQRIAVKVIRSIEGNRPETKAQCLSMLDSLHHQTIPEHPNVSQMWIQDVVMKGHFVPATVMRFYTAGNIIEVARRVPSVDTPSLVKGAAQGLAYLHSKGIWHGNLHPNNILISENGRACISDVGVKALKCSIVNIGSIPGPSTWFYKSPDALEKPIFSMAEDVYSFACTVYVVYNRKVPFEPNPTAYVQGLQSIIEQGFIPKPKSMSEEIWELLKECWEFDASKRPTMQQVAARLGVQRG